MLLTRLSPSPAAAVQDAAGRSPSGRYRAWLVNGGTVLTQLEQLHAVWPDLRGRTLVGLDLRGDTNPDWDAAVLDGAVLLGCLLVDGEGDHLGRKGALVLPPLDDVPFEVYRPALYHYDELVAPGHAGGPTADERIGEWFQASTTGLRDELLRAVHDATIDSALSGFVVGRRMVGLMGGHAVRRDTDLYRASAQLGRALSRSGYCVATGGGPGVMEAANLGAWLAPHEDGALAAALGVLAEAPLPAQDRRGYVDAALEVRARWQPGGESLGVPTWVYLDEPTSAFATHIAKYFTNSVREDGLLALARSGVVYAPGGAGTVQEVFTDAAQNSLTLYEVRSPTVFYGRTFFEKEQPEVLAAVRRQAEAFGWDHLVAVHDDPAEVVAFVNAHDPDRAGAEGVLRQRQRSH